MGSSPLGYDYATESQRWMPKPATAVTGDASLEVGRLHVNLTVVVCPIRSGVIRSESTRQRYLRP